MAHIGNMHPQLVITIIQTIERNGIIEIFGVHRIDGKDGLLSQV